MSNDTTLLFGLAGVEVAAVKLNAANNPVLALVTAADGARCCPDCRVASRYPHSWVRTRPRDLPLAGRGTALTWTKRRWRCRNPGCGRATFTESIPQIPPRHRITVRAREAIGAAVADHGRTVIQAAREHEVSWPTAHGAFDAAAARVLPEQTPIVENLGIDETRRGKPKFRLVKTGQGDAWEVIKDTWHIGFVDLDGKAGLLGQVEGRNAASVTMWIEARGRIWRDAVRSVAIDMCTVFKCAVRASLSHARLVVDRFHVVQLANDAVTEVRRRVTVQQRGRQGRKGNREWELRNRLTRSAARMHANHLDAMVDDLNKLPKKIGEPILTAWNCKEDLMDLLALHGTHAHRVAISRALIRFYESAAASGLPEIERLAATVSTWWPEILAGITTGITNAASEGINRAIKTDARCAYGYRNPVNQRLRARCATTRRARGHLPTRTSGPHAQPRHPKPLQHG